jgi:hypothetical protein
MKTMRTVLAAAVLAAALTSCSSGPTDAAAPPAAPAATPAPTVVPPADAGAALTGADAEVQAAFLDYNQALGARDFARACSHSAPETSQKLVEALKAQRMSVGTCEEAFSAVLSVPGGTEATDEVVTSLHVDGVTVTGDTATIAWTAKSKGQPKSTKTNMRRINGEWKLLASAA